MKIDYRPDIDGLRALAIIPVVIFHAFPDLIPGGFIGVDIFFVISGYLISSIIYSEVENGKFSFLNFYSRRIRRIFPSLIVMMVIIGIAAWFLFLSDDFRLVAKHIIWGILFSQNINLYFESGYFDTATELKPLMHLWSLGVEEQFYIFFPFIILFARRKHLILPSLLIIFILSLIVSIISTPVNASWAFYLPFSRMWELMAGCIVAYIVKEKKITINSTESHYISIICIVILVSCFFFIDKNDYFPGYIALLPVICTSVLIMCGSTAITNRLILGSKIFVIVGLISFPLYLWHWPILSLLRILSTSEPSIMNKSLAIIASFAMAFATFYFIERPVRNYKNPAQIASILLGISILLLVIALAVVSGKISSRNNSQDVADIISAAGEWEYPKGLSDTVINGVPVKYIKGERYTIFYGDSNVEEYSTRVVMLAEKSGGKRGAIFLTSSGCLPVGSVYLNGYDECKKMPEMLSKLAASGIADRVVISALWYKYFAGDPGKNIYIDKDYQAGSTEGTTRAVSHLGEIFSMLKKNNLPIYLVMEKPTGPQFDPKKLIARSEDGKIEVVTEGVDRKSFEEPFNFARKEMTEMALKHGVHIIKPMDHLCSDTICMPFSSKRKAMYKDDSHLRPSYVRESVTYIDETMK
ncbi:acyltransferase family protein [Pantoea allii]|uniref:acyltransferase family protein n=1 Tax=Pantoea allii TaxID=574096 RepID=UPI001F4D71BE|nr:acyltransferase family protein [Pantoea allii]MCH9297008.1 acyltransferase [Pantoea allii]